MNKTVQVRTKKHKEAMIEALQKTLGIVTPALQITNTGRATYYGWLKSDPDFKSEIDNLPDMALDFAESKLHKLIKDENPTAIIFFLKTKGKGRGYIERTEIDSREKQIIEFRDISKPPSENE